MRGQKVRKLKNIYELADAIAAGYLPLAFRGPRYELWDGRIARGDFYEVNGKKPDGIFSREVFLDDEKLIPLAEKLLAGESIVISTGTDPATVLEWTIV